MMRKQSTEQWSCSTCGQPAVISHQHNTTFSLCRVWFDPSSMCPLFFLLPCFLILLLGGALWAHTVGGKRGVFLVGRPITTESVGTHTSRCSLSYNTMSHATQCTSFCSLSFTQNTSCRHTPPQTRKLS